MNKRSRFILILVVLAVCFAFLWPSLCWYYRTPNDVQKIALSSLEKIKDESEKKAREEVTSLKAIAKENSAAILDKQYDYVVKAAKKAYKADKKDVPAQMDVAAVLSAFSSATELQSVFEKHYRDRYLKAKNYYTNSVKLGLDLSGGMNIIIHADLDAALEKQRETSEVDNPDYFKKQAMTQAVETLTSSIDKFGLSSPVIRQQGDDRIYVEIPGQADGESVNSSAFSDENEVSPYALPPVLYLAERGIINGTDGKFMPKKNITRAETAVMLFGFIEKELME